MVNKIYKYALEIKDKNYYIHQVFVEFIHKIYSGLSLRSKILSYYSIEDHQLVSHLKVKWI